MVVLIVTGLLVTNLIGRRLVRYWDGIIRRIPLVRSIHGGGEELRGERVLPEQFVSQGGDDPVSPGGVWSIGFITSDNVAELAAKTGVQHACVYIPTTPNPTSRFIVMVPITEVVELQMSVDAADEDDHYLRCRNAACSSDSGSPRAPGG